MPKDELAGRKSSLGLTESFAWNSGEKISVWPLEEVAGISGGQQV